MSIKNLNSILNINSFVTEVCPANWFNEKEVIAYRHPGHRILMISQNSDKLADGLYRDSVLSENGIETTAMDAANLANDLYDFISKQVSDYELEFIRKRFSENT